LSFYFSLLSLGIVILLPPSSPFFKFPFPNWVLLEKDVRQLGYQALRVRKGKGERLVSYEQVAVKEEVAT